jgi:hypothetical protein
MSELDVIRHADRVTFVNMANALFRAPHLPFTLRRLSVPTLPPRPSWAEGEVDRGDLGGGSPATSSPTIYMPRTSWPEAMPVPEGEGVDVWMANAAVPDLHGEMSPQAAAVTCGLSAAGTSHPSSQMQGCSTRSR